MFLVFDWWLDVIWLKSHRNATNCIDFNIVIRILNTPVSAKMAQGQRKWHVVRLLYAKDICTYFASAINYSDLSITEPEWLASSLKPQSNVAEFVCLFFCLMFSLGDGVGVVSGRVFIYHMHRRGFFR